MKPVRFLAVSAIAGLFAVVSMASAAQPMPVGPTSPGLGGASTFIPPAQHQRGVRGGRAVRRHRRHRPFIPRIRPAVCGG